MRVRGTCRGAGAVLLLTVGCGSDGAAGAPPPPDTTADVFGPVHSGNYNNGPVDYVESMYHNACAPAEKYPPEIQQLYGPYLGGVDNSVGSDGSLCDACALVTTQAGKSVVVHLVTYGISKGPGDLDLSPEAYDAIHEGPTDAPRPMPSPSSIERRMDPSPTATA